MSRYSSPKHEDIDLSLPHPSTGVTVADSIKKTRPRAKNPDTSKSPLAVHKENLASPVRKPIVHVDYSSLASPYVNSPVYNKKGLVDSPIRSSCDDRAEARSARKEKSPQSTGSIPHFYGHNTYSYYPPPFYGNHYQYAQPSFYTNNSQSLPVYDNSYQYYSPPFHQQYEYYYGPQYTPSYDPWSQLSDDAKQRMSMNMREEIHKLCMKHEGLPALNETDADGNIIYDDNDGFTLKEIHNHLTTLRSIVSQREKTSFFNKGIQIVYKFIALIMEKVFDVGMGEYFDDMSQNIADYSALFAQDTDIGKYMYSMLPSVTNDQGPNTKSAIFVFLFQIIIGIGAAIASKYIPGQAIGRKFMQSASNISTNVGDYLFKQGDIWGAVMQCFSGSASKKNRGSEKKSGPATIV